MKHALLTLLLLLLPLPALAAAFETPVWLEEMTWPEVRERMQQGATTVIVPTGGTEQNGPHLVIGKHNMIVQRNAGLIARELGNALVAPVVAYVPEGRISPPEGHMRFPGTISVSETTFGAILEDAARSLRQHGFRLICFIGDHGGNQEVQDRIADKLTAEWRGSGVRVINVPNYYRDNGQEEWMRARKLSVENPKAHAGFMDTSELMAIYPEGVRKERITAFNESQFATLGAAGDASKASAEYGTALLRQKVTAAVEQIRNAASLKR